MYFKNYTLKELDEVTEKFLLENDLLAFDDYLFYLDQRLNKYRPDTRRHDLIIHWMIKNKLYNIFPVSHIFSSVIYKLNQSRKESDIYISTDRKIFYRGYEVELGLLKAHKKSYFNNFINMQLLMNN